MNENTEHLDKHRALAAAQAGYLRLSETVADLAKVLPMERMAPLLEQLTIMRRALDQLRSDLDESAD